MRSGCGAVRSVAFFVAGGAFGDSWGRCRGAGSVLGAVLGGCGVFPRGVLRSGVLRESPTADLGSAACGS